MDKVIWKAPEDGEPCTEVIYKSGILFTTGPDWKVIKAIKTEEEEEVTIILRIKKEKPHETDRR
jgi:hypothetical protein